MRFPLFLPVLLLFALPLLAQEDSLQPSPRPALPGAAQPDARGAALLRAQNLYALQLYGAAIEPLEALALAGDVEALFWRGRCRAALGQHAAAIEDFSRILKTDNQHLRAYNERGMAYCHLNQYRQALPDFQRALLLDSTQAALFNNVGTALYYNQDIDKPSASDLRLAHSYFHRATVLDTSLALAWRNRALMQLLLGQPDVALADLAQGLRLAPDDALGHFYMGVAHADKGEGAAALRCFDRALHHAPGLALAHEERGRLYARMGERAKALAEFASAQRLADADAYVGLMDYERAKIYAEEGETGRMYEALKAARRRGALADQAVFNDFLHSPAFAAYRGERKFLRLTQALRAQERERKFLESALRWYRMRH